jgi:hypothetical protein
MWVIFQVRRVEHDGPVHDGWVDAAVGGGLVVFLGVAIVENLAFRRVGRVGRSRMPGAAVTALLARARRLTALKYVVLAALLVLIGVMFRSLTGSLLCGGGGVICGLLALTFFQLASRYDHLADSTPAQPDQAG